MMDIDVVNFREREIGVFTPAQIAQMNSLAIRKMDQTVPELREGSRLIQAIDEQTVASVLASINRHPVVGAANKPNYAQPGVEIGYCFGRAMYVDLLLRQLGVHENSIRKIYIVGPQNAQNAIWSYHVATMVYTTRGWRVIDSEMAHAAGTIEQWWTWNNYVSVDKKARLYFAPARKFGGLVSPNTPGEYSRVQMGLDLRKNEDFFRHYFKDMMAWFAQPGNAKFTALGLPTPDQVRTKLGKPARPGACKAIFG
jgi:hypothetical protein